ncbi:DNA polymerase [Streptomyces sp. NPDC006655]|uniref:DNA polymerase n=1 Tax=Streptomyces sp. NPDC006655 TaxID=3156898 RepID=UPI0034553D08
MQNFYFGVMGDTITVNVPETDDDLREFFAWVQRANARGPIALDTETTGLDIFSPTYGLRTVQFGDGLTAWVIRWEWGGRFAEAARWALRVIDRFLIHNASFDWLVLDRHAGIPMEVLSAKTTDTRLLAALVDPRQPQDGGIGTGLKPLSAFYIDPTAPDTAGDLTAVFRSEGLTKETGWRGIDIRNPTYNLYAGLDVIYTSRLEPALRREMARLDVRAALEPYEHELAYICAYMMRTGFLLDQEYTQGLADKLSGEELRYRATAERYGVANVNSTAQIAEALCGMGESLTERTASGALKVDKAVLLDLADLDRDWKRVGARTPNPLADAVIRAKRAGKWRSTYADTFLESMDANGRIHPFIGSLVARTARMSITRPALQTLPSGDWMIRRALLAEPGHVIISTDFTAVEMRVLASLANVRRMREAIASGEDLHDFTARQVWGPGFTKQHRKIGKGIGFSKVYGGGAATTARQTGADENDVRRAMAEYDRVYPEIKRWSYKLQREARWNSWVGVSETGRRLPVDRNRAYAIVNYVVQSTARDCLGNALITAKESGLLDYMRLPIHDEILASAPRAEAKEIAKEFERCMTFSLGGVPIEAEAEIGGNSWGSLYGAAA